LPIRDAHPRKPRNDTKAKNPASRLFPPERAALGEPCLATSGLAEHSGAAGADDDGLGVGEDGRDGEAAGALHIHEERAGALDESLELVLLGLRGGKGVEEVNGENLWWDIQLVLDVLEFDAVVVGRIGRRLRCGCPPPKTSRGASRAAHAANFRAPLTGKSPFASFTLKQ
jgi:hypothetical protein